MDTSPAVSDVRARGDEYPEADRLILDFERSWWMFPGPKSVQIRARLGMSSPRYYRRLGEIISDPESQRYDPMTVKRVIRSRRQRRAARYVVKSVHPSVK